MSLDRLTSLVQGLRIETVGSADVVGASLFVYSQPTGYRVQVGGNGVGAVVALKVSWGSAADPLVSAVGDFAMSVSLEDDLYALVRLLAEEVKKPRCGSVSVLTGYGEALIVHLFRAALTAGAAENGLLAGLADPRLARALVVMHDQPYNQWRVEDLADEAGMSRSAFMARFKTVMKETPMTYLRRWRIARARDALRRGDRVTDVARRFGYRSSDAFARAFFKVEGQLPSKIAMADIDL